MSGKRVKMEESVEGRMTTRSMANQGKGKEHPLMNHLVLEKVFDYCSVKDLKVVRLVSPLWRDCARKKWDKSVKLRVKEVPDDHRSSRGRQDLAKYKLFLQLLDKQKSMTRIQENWTTLSGQLKTLELGSVTVPTVKSFRNAVFRCFPNLENLKLGPIKVLQVGHLPTEPAPPEPFQEPRIQDQHRNLKSLQVGILCGHFAHIPVSWVELFALFPCLEAIHVLVSTKPMRTQTVFQAINRIRAENPSKLNIKHVSFSITITTMDDDISPAALATLMDRRLQLETLEFKGLMGGRVTTSLRKILQVHAGTLKTLKFDKGPGPQFSQDSGLPLLPKLQKLSLELYCSPESIEFLKFTPNVRELKIFSYHFINFENPGQAENSNLDHLPIMLSSCKELEICDRMRTLSMESLISWTPKLEALSIRDVDNAVFAMICEGWTGLVKLSVEDSEVDASGITGWNEEDVKLFDSMRRSQPTAALPFQRPITVPRANVTDLKNLQILTMNAPFPEEPPINLGRTAGIFGIEMLPDLRRLCIKNYLITPNDRYYWSKLHKWYPLPE